jgi:hypothetical protein
MYKNARNLHTGPFSFHYIVNTGNMAALIVGWRSGIGGRNVAVGWEASGVVQLQRTCWFPELTDKDSEFINRVRRDSLCS